MTHYFTASGAYWANERRKRKERQRRKIVAYRRMRRRLEKIEDVARTEAERVYITGGY